MYISYGKKSKNVVRYWSFVLSVEIFIYFLSKPRIIFHGKNNIVIVIGMQVGVSYIMSMKRKHCFEFIIHYKLMINYEIFIIFYSIKIQI